MIRVVIEAVFAILVIVVARAIITSLLKGISNASSATFQQQQQPPQSGSQSTPTPPKSGSELHRDPVCGTYVVESTPHRRQSAGQTFYYCSEACREKHAMAVR